MRLCEIHSSNDIVIVDVQPAFSKGCTYILPGLVELLNNHTSGDIWMVYNYGDDYHDILQYWFDAGLGGNNEDEFSILVDNIRWTCKEFGFFRGWMDAGVSSDVIISTAKLMIAQDVSDSRSLFNGDLDKQNEHFADFEMGHFTTFNESYPLALPDISDELFRYYSGAMLCGGGEDECLAEIALCFDVYDVPYTINRRYVY